jgi:integrase
MRLDDYSERDGKRVWLAPDEIERLCGLPEPLDRQIALSLAGKAGLRRKAIVTVTVGDVMHADDGWMRVREEASKTGEFRECPIPSALERMVWRHSDSADRGADDSILDASTSSIYRWVREAADELHSETGDDGWLEVGPHDLRRSWGAHLLWDCGVSPMSVMEFGGWNDWPTFKQHYMGEMSPRARQRERGKVDFYGGEPAEDDPLWEPGTPDVGRVYGSGG